MIIDDGRITAAEVADNVERSTSSCHEIFELF